MFIESGEVGPPLKKWLAEQCEDMVLPGGINALKGQKPPDGQADGEEDLARSHAR